MERSESGRLASVDFGGLYPGSRKQHSSREREGDSSHIRSVLAEWRRATTPAPGRRITCTCASPTTENCDDTCVSRLASGSAETASEYGAHRPRGAVPGRSRGLHGSDFETPGWSIFSRAGQTAYRPGQMYSTF